MIDERAHARLKKGLKAFGKVLASIACLVLVAKLVDGAQLVALLRRSRPEWIFLGLVASFVTFVAQAVRWKFTAERLGLTLPFRVALAEYYLAALLNQLLPSGMGGEAARVLRYEAPASEEARDSRMRWLLAIVLERIAGQLVLWLLIAASIPLWSSEWGRYGVQVACAMGLLGAILFAYAKKRLRQQGASRFATQVRQMRAAWIDGRAWMLQLTTSLVAVLSVIAMYVCTVRALQIGLPLRDFAKLAPLVLAASSLPVSFAGWGPREIVSALLFAKLGLDATEGTTVSVGFGILSLVSSTPGLLVWFRR